MSLTNTLRCYLAWILFYILSAKDTLRCSLAFCIPDDEKKSQFGSGFSVLMRCEESKTSIGVRIPSGIAPASGGLANIFSQQNIRTFSPFDKLNKHNTLLFSINELFILL